MVFPEKAHAAERECLRDWHHFAIREDKIYQGTEYFYCIVTFQCDAVLITRPRNTFPYSIDFQLITLCRRLVVTLFDAQMRIWQWFDVRLHCVHFF